MSMGGSITSWIEQLKGGDREVAQRLWEVYFRRLVPLARARLQGTVRVAADEEDVALSAFGSFCRGAEAGRFPQLHDRDDLWRLLVTLTERKAIGLIRHERRQKRGGGIVRSSEAPADRDGSEETEAVLDRLVGREPTPEFAALVADECRRLLDGLGDAELRTIAVWKMEGYTTEEIALRLGRVPRTVERKLRMIRSLWGWESGS
jgi:DNA-directed RNA polymerase specialized sigma24 family protein